MKWFKHSSTASQDAKLKKLRIKYGMEGYGLYWYCVELIASEVDVNKLTFELEHDSEVLSHDTGIHYERVEEMMRHMVSLGLFQGDNHTITCMQLAKRADEYLTKTLKRAGKLEYLDSVRTKSGRAQDNVRPEERKVKESIKNTSSISQAKTDHSAAIQKWNEFAKQSGLRTIQGVTPKRKDSIKSAYALYKKTSKSLEREPKSEEQFLVALVDRAISTHDPFHLGDNDKGWKMNFDYLLQRKIVDRVTEHGSIAL